MKVLSPAFFIIVVSTGLCQPTPTDLRTVNGIQVNLQPLHDWLQSPHGERPMKHWKRVKVIAVLDRIAGWDKCGVLIEGKSKTDIFLANLPDPVKAFLSTFKQQADAVKALSAEIEADKMKREQLWNRFTDSNTNAWTLSQTSKGTVIDNHATRLANVRAMDATIKARQAQLNELKDSLLNSIETSGEKATVLAMFTGNSYAKLQVWDCGKK